MQVEIYSRKREEKSFNLDKEGEDKMLNKNSANSTVGGVSGVNKQVVSKRVARLNHLGEDTSNYDCNGDRIHSHGMEENGPSNYSLNMLANPGLKKPKTV